MNNHLLKLFLGLIILAYFVSCHSRDAKVDITKNDETIDHLSNLATTPIIDSIDITQLTKDKWYYVVSTDCITHITFKQDYQYEEDNCEWELTFKGKYEISKDTLFLTQYGLASELPNENRIVKTGIYTYIYQKDSLFFICNQQIKDERVIATYCPDTPIYFKREIVLDK